MNYTGFSFNGKPLACLSVGCMRFPSREMAKKVILKCAEHNVFYLDTAPGYCYNNEEENSESWTGGAIRDIRNKSILSSKCSTGGGGDSEGTFDPVHGFSISTADETRQMIEQSLKRTGADFLDCYQMWAIQQYPLFEKALKKGGWLEGALKAKNEGLIKHIGITTHAGSEDIKRFADSGCVEMITLPFNLLDISRLEGIKYALSKKIAVIVMNPLAGGLLGHAESPIIDEFLSKTKMDSLSDMAIRFCLSFGVSALSGMASEEDAESNCISASKPLLTEGEAIALRESFLALTAGANFKCTSCGYCMPCPQKINIPEVLKMRNYYLVLGMKDAGERLKNAYRWDEGFKVENCVECGSCESHCPNGVKASELMKEILAMRGK